MLTQWRRASSLEQVEGDRKLLPGSNINIRRYKQSRIYGSASEVHKEMTLKRKTGVFLRLIRVTDLPDHTPDLTAVIQ